MSCCVSWCSYFADADDSLPPSGSTDEGVAQLADHIEGGSTKGGERAVPTTTGEQAIREAHKVQLANKRAYNKIQWMKAKEHGEMDDAQGKALETKQQKRTS
jgi:hypothetical protein